MPITMVFNVSFMFLLCKSQTPTFSLYGKSQTNDFFPYRSIFLVNIEIFPLQIENEDRFLRES